MEAIGRIPVESPRMNKWCLWFILCLLFQLDSVYTNTTRTIVQHETTATARQNTSAGNLTDQGITTDTTKPTVSSQVSSRPTTVNNNSTSPSPQTNNRSSELKPAVVTVSHTVSEQQTYSKTSVTVLSRGPTTSGSKNSSVWSVPLIVLVVVCGVLLVVCLVCVIIICRLKKSLQRRSKLYPGVVDEDDHTYMDLGDSPDRAPPPVELKSVSASLQGETKLHEANEKTGEFKSYKDRKRKPAPPLPQTAVPTVKDKKPAPITNDVGAPKVKRQSTKKKKPPTYNNSVPLDLTSDDDNDLYEPYDHSNRASESYTTDMIDNVLQNSNEPEKTGENVIEDERQRQTSFESETSNKLRLAQGSFIVSDDAHSEGLAFTERQVSHSGLPEVVVEYNANKEAESPLSLNRLHAYENSAFQNDAEISSASSEHMAQNKEVPIERGKIQSENEIRNKLPVYEFATEPPSLGEALYDDDIVPDTKLTDDDALDNLALYEDAEGNPQPSALLYDDNFIPNTKKSEKETVDILPLYDDANDTVTNQSEPAPGFSATETHAVNASGQLSEVLTENGPLYDDGEINQKVPTDINDLGVYEDYEIHEIQKLPPAPPPPFGHNLKQQSNSDLLSSNTKEPSEDIKITHENDEFSIGSKNAASLTKSMSSGHISSDAEFVSNSFGNERSDFERKTESENSLVISPGLLDFSIKPENKFRSGSKIDVFDDPGTPNSPESYFLDMNDLPSEIVDNTTSDKSPVTDEEKSITVAKNDKEVLRNIQLVAPTSNINNSLNMDPTVQTQNITTDMHTEISQNEKPINTEAKRILTSDAGQANTTGIENVLHLGGNTHSPRSALQSDPLPSVQENGSIQNSSQWLGFENFAEYDKDIYDMPPPNFPPPPLQLNN